MTTQTITVALETAEFEAMLASAITQVERLAAQIALAQAANPSGVGLAATAMAASASSRPLSRRSFLGFGWRRP